MTEKNNRLYADLAWLWPLWGDPSEYAPYCESATRLIKKYAQREVHTLLNVCCGGGKIEHDFHRLCLFPLEAWRRLLHEIGFEVHEEGYSENDRKYVEFVCIKPV